MEAKLITGGIYTMEMYNSTLHFVILGQDKKKCIFHDMSDYLKIEINSRDKIVSEIINKGLVKRMIDTGSFFAFPIEKFNQFVTGYLGQIPDEILEELKEEGRRKYPLL